MAKVEGRFIDEATELAKRWAPLASDALRERIIVDYALQLAGQPPRSGYILPTGGRPYDGFGEEPDGRDPNASTDPELEKQLAKRKEEIRRTWERLYGRREVTSRMVFSTGEFSDIFDDDISARARRTIDDYVPVKAKPKKKPKMEIADLKPKRKVVIE